MIIGNLLLVPEETRYPQRVSISFDLATTVTCSRCGARSEISVHLNEWTSESVPTLAEITEARWVAAQLIFAERACYNCSHVDSPRQRVHYKRLWREIREAVSYNRIRFRLEHPYEAPWSLSA